MTINTTSNTIITTFLVTRENNLFLTEAKIAIFLILKKKETIQLFIRMQSHIQYSPVQTNQYCFSTGSCI